MLDKDNGRGEDRSQKGRRIATKAQRLEENGG